MSAHTECGRVGKFDCAFDEYIYDSIEDPGEGDVQSPSAWFMEIDLDRLGEDDAAAIEHYGSEWLIARELNDGRWFVELYPTLTDREERLTELRAALEQWDSAEFDDA